MVCLAMAALGLIELGSSTTFGTYTPAMMVGVIFISIIGDRWMRIGIDAFTIVLIGVVSWVGGVRGSDLVAVVLVYASTIVIITWITARTVGSLNQNVNFRHAINTLNEAIDGGDPGDATTNADDIADVIRRGLPAGVRHHPGRPGGGLRPQRAGGAVHQPGHLAGSPGRRHRPGRAVRTAPGPPGRRRGGRARPTASSRSGTAPKGSWSWWWPGGTSGARPRSGPRRVPPSSPRHSSG